MWKGCQSQRKSDAKDWTQRVQRQEDSTLKDAHTHSQDSKDPLPQTKEWLLVVRLFCQAGDKKLFQNRERNNFKKDLCLNKLWNSAYLADENKYVSS